MRPNKNGPRFCLAAAAFAAWAVSIQGQQPAPPQGDRFKSGIELINVTATVSDPGGHFVPGLQKDDFIVYEDDRQVEVTQFDAERVPVSLGIALDTSGSMAGEKMDAARAALNRFLVMLLDREDEIFLYRFSNYPALIQGWTSDRAPFLRAPAAPHAQRRHGHVRHGARRGAADRQGAAREKGARS